MKRMTKRQIRKQKAARYHQQILAAWFAQSDWTLRRLLTEIEVERRAAHCPMGDCPLALFKDVHASSIPNNDKLRIAIAAQWYANNPNIRWRLIP